MTCSSSTISKEISIPYPLYESQKGNYFIGQTPILNGLADQRALATLQNPVGSHVDVYVNAITITNISALNVSAEIYVRSNLLLGQASALVSCANLSLLPPPLPEAEIHFLSTSPQPPIKGFPIFSRIIPPFTTVVIDGSQLIVGDNQCLAVYLGGYLPVDIDSAIVAFGWWEQGLHY